MAKAEKLPSSYTLNLTLNQAEAETLWIILGKIAGTPSTSRRRFAEAIRNALDSAGVTAVCNPITSYVYFADESVNG